MLAAHLFLLLRIPFNSLPGDISTLSTFREVSTFSLRILFLVCLIIVPGLQGFHFVGCMETVNACCLSVSF